MNTPITVSATEAGIVRLFDVALPEDAEITVDDVSAALGDVPLDGAHVDIITVSDLEDLGLYGYLRDGMGISAAELDPARAQLAAFTGTVVVLRSAAFGGQRVTLNPRAPLRWVASFGELPMDLSQAPLSSASAKGVLGGGAPPAKPLSHRKPLLIVLGAFFVILLATIATLISATR